MEITLIPGYGSSDNALIVVETWRYRLAVDMLATARNMSLCDFRKMIRVICRMGTPGERFEYLKHWHDFLVDRFDVPHRAKLLAVLNKEYEKLPAWFLEGDYEADC